MTDLSKVAQNLLKPGFSVLPTKADKTPAIPSWKRFQNTPMTNEEAKQHFANAVSLAVIGGKVSCNLECLDFDDPTVYAPFLESLAEYDAALAASLVKLQTPSGGYHIVYCSTDPVAGNLKLAMSEDGKEVRIETRGEGGYFLTAPSTGYSIIEHNIIATPTILPAQVEMIHALAGMFDLRPQQAERAPHADRNNSGSPGSEFNKCNPITAGLTHYGWRETKRTSLGVGWTRPGKESGISGVLLDRTGNFYCWSSNAFPLEPGKSYGSFALYTAYEHNGDFKAAAGTLAGHGYGTPRAQIGTQPGTGIDWPLPLPLTVRQQTAPYPLDVLPGTIGAAVQEVVDFVQCPMALGACSALAVLSTVGQGLVDVRRAETLEGPTSLFLLAIADSGERKTTVDGHFSKPIYQWGAEQEEAAKPDLRKYEAEQAAWEAKKSGLLTAIKEYSKSGKATDELEKKVIGLELEKPSPPKVPNLTFGDTTPEALAYRLAHGWPVGGVLSSEAGTVFGGHAMGKDSAMRNMAMLNTLWDAKELKTDRRTTVSYTLRGARLTMGLAVQSETVRSFLDSSNGLARGIGWLARFLIAWPESTQGERMFKDPPENWPHLAKFHRRLGALLDHPLAFNDRGELEPKMLELSPAAKVEWVAFNDHVEAELKPGREMAESKDVASKAADNAARLAALFHLFENDSSGAIGLDHMRSATIVAHWHLYEARRFMGEIALPIELNNAAKLDAWLLGYCQQNRVTELSKTTIMQSGPNCVRGKRTLDPALEGLEEAGRVRVVKEGRRILVKINPALLGGG